MVVKATGYAWYWGYEYPADQGGGFKFDSNMVDAEGSQARPAAASHGRQRDGRSGQQDHTGPGDGRRRDAHLRDAVLRHQASTPFPGRLNETWFRAEHEGVYHGQCSELCGNGHPYMPITVRVVSEQRIRRLAGRGEEEIRLHRRLGLAQARHRSVTTSTKDHRGLSWHTQLTPLTRITTITPDLLAPLVLFDEPQGHRHALPALRLHGGPRRRLLLVRHAARAAGARPADSSPTRRPTTSS